MHQGFASPFAQVPPSPLAGRTVLQMIPSLQAGGTERMTIEIAAALAEVGARALVATTGGRLVSELQARGGVWVPFPADTKNPIAMLGNVRKLRRLIATERPAVIHAQSRAPAWVALGATRLTRTPFITTYHGSYEDGHAIKLQYNSVMARGDAVLANSYYSGDMIVRRYPSARDRIRVIWPGIDLRSFYAGAVNVGRIEALRAAWGVEPDQRIVLAAGRLAEGKGHRVLIEAMARLQARGVTDTIVVLVGEADERQDYAAGLDQLAADNDLGGIVRRVGACADMPAAFIAASVVVVPSTSPSTFGLAAVEAQAMGTPVIVSNLGAIPETIRAPPDVSPEQRTGWRVPPGDPDALADALAEVLALGASAIDALSLRARTHVEQHFSSDRMTEATLDAYAAVIEGQTPKNPEINHDG